MKATYKTIPTWYKEATITGESKKTLIKKYKLENRKNVSFMAYYLSDTLNTAKKKELIKQYSNIDLYYSECTYAPEIKENVVLICSHCLRG